MRLMGDLTTNHCGDAHEWFQPAIADASSPEASYFTFTDHPHSYVCWFDHPSLPKFDHRDPGLRRRLYEGPDSVVARWLGPHGLDGWRIDVANMTARLGTIDLNQMVATTIRATMAEANPESLLLAEHSHDASARPARRRLARRDELRRLHPSGLAVADAARSGPVRAGTVHRPAQLPRDWDGGGDASVRRRPAVAGHRPRAHPGRTPTTPCGSGRCSATRAW